MLGTIKAIARTPVVLFQMGKVGSSSLELTLSRRFKGSVMHAHHVSHLTAQQQSILRWRRRLGLPIYVISPVREPVGRNISAFFHNFKRDTGFELSQRAWTILELRDLFLQHYPHNICLDWFDACMFPTFGFDVLSEPFPIERKWKAYRNGSVRLLVYRSDLDPTLQLKVVSQFLHCSINQWDYANKAEDKEYADLYQRFCAEVKLPESYLCRMYVSCYGQHFWSDAERADLAKKWKRD